MSSNNKEYQKIASRKHYLANKEAIKARTAKNRQKLYDYVRELKEKTPCKDCGINYSYYVMDFDHLPEYKKEGVINDFILRSSKTKLLEEIAKCDLVCSNCHRERTQKRHATLAQLVRAPLL